MDMARKQNSSTPSDRGILKQMLWWILMIYWLSRLTCHEQNFITKVGAQRYASEHWVALIAPDTSPEDARSMGKTTVMTLGQVLGSMSMPLSPNGRNITTCTLKSLWSYRPSS